MTRFFLTERYVIPLLLGFIVGYGAFAGLNLWFVVLSTAAWLAAVLHKAHMPRIWRLFYLVLPFIALASATWARPAVGVVVGGIVVLAYLLVSGRVVYELFSPRDLKITGLVMLLFLVFFNFFMLRGNFPFLSGIVSVVTALLSFLIISVHVTVIHNATDFGREELTTTSVFTILMLEVLFLFYFLPFGYLALAFAATVWYYATMHLYERLARVAYSSRAVFVDPLLAIVAIVAIFLTSGIGAR